MTEEPFLSTSIMLPIRMNSWSCLQDLACEICAYNTNVYNRLLYIRNCLLFSSFVHKLMSYSIFYRKRYC